MARNAWIALAWAATALGGCDGSIRAKPDDAGSDPDSKADSDGDADADTDADADADADSDADADADSDADADADADSDADADGDADADADLPIVTAADVSVWTKALTDSDVDCLIGEGYRHVICGTQLLEVTRQQLEIAIRGGLTVDLYIYLYWDEAIDVQVGEAIDLVGEFPEIGRVWLDVEEDPAGRGAVEIGDIVQDGLDLLDAADIPSGIYSGPGFWIGEMDDTDRFSDRLLWFAHYDQEPTFDSWDDPDDPDQFGGWVTPFAKQYMDNHLRVCDLTLDHDIIRWDQTPTVEVDRTVPPDDGDPPAAPTDLRPTGGLHVTTEWVRPTAPTIWEATGWQIAVQSWSGDRWVDYFTWDSDVSSVTIYPQLADRTYRFRIRAENAHGWGPWSEWAWFDFGDVADPPPPDQIQS